MNQFKSILVGIDFSARSGRLTEGARSVVLQALRLSRENGAKLQFLYSKVRDTEEEPGEELDISAGVGEWQALCIEGGLKDPEYVQPKEAPWLAFIHRVLSGGYDLVMVAKRNRTRRMDQQMDSVSMKLVRKCPCPVWGSWASAPMPRSPWALLRPVSLPSSAKSNRHGHGGPRRHPRIPQGQYGRTLDLQVGIILDGGQTRRPRLPVA